MNTNKGQTFHNDVNKVADILLLSKEEFLNRYPYLTETDFYTTVNNILYTLFTYEQRKNYYEFLVSEEKQELAEKILHKSNNLSIIQTKSGLAVYLL